MKLFINFCSRSSLKSATDCCQTERQIQQDAWDSAGIAGVSQRCLHATIRKYLKRNNDHLITLQIWIERRYLVQRATGEAILKPSSEAQSSFWINSRIGKVYGTIFRRSNDVPTFWNSLTSVCEGWRKTFWAFFFTQISVRTYGVCAVLNSWDNFW